MKHNCRRNAHYILHSVCACFCIFCCCCCLFIFPVFSVVGFPFHPQFFFRMLHLLFLAFYTRDFVTYIFETPPFFLHKSAFHPYENVRSSFMGHILNQLYFTSAWLLVTLVTLSKTVNPLAEKPLSVLFNLGAVHTNPEKINAVSKMFRFVWTWPLGPVYKEGG